MFQAKDRSGDGWGTGGEEVGRNGRGGVGEGGSGAIRWTIN